ncbi:hypothetical protein C4D60_Mb00t00900 [Musa balbisiana]|uniref:Uncharacterized protein n=1 Tax=Musa balbisiana TaxID=52838 RepID=A0A4S8I870_MUSBA|nr:hypothetical protein C4D60_Mb00t00900 [Musa balbisiana]
MAVEGQRDAKNAAMIPSVRTLADSKLGGSASWSSIGVPSSKLLLKGCRKDSSIAYQKRINT